MAKSKNLKAKIVVAKLGRNNNHKHSAKRKHNG